VGASLQIAEGIEEAEMRAQALIEIAKAMARAGMTQQAQETLHQALQAAKDIEERWRQAQVLKAIAEAMAEIRMWEQALQIAEGIEEAEMQVQALIEIAKAMARAGITQQAQETLHQALQAAKDEEREASTSLEGHRRGRDWMWERPPDSRGSKKQR
jgi:tetratricopeptide (TPR) repeat protein